MSGLPTVAPSSSPTAPTPPTSPTYILLDKGEAASCPIGTDPVPEDECLEAAGLAAGHLDLPDWVFKGTWTNWVPCGCFIFHGGGILVDYNLETTHCGDAANTQLICKTNSPSTAEPTESPVAVTTPPAPSPTLPTGGSPNYFFLTNQIRWPKIWQLPWIEQFQLHYSITRVIAHKVSLE